MRFISLFAGIGGFDLGLERAGWTCVAQVECEPFALEVLAKHWPEVPRFTDVRSVSAESFPPCDAIVGGFPCQPHSVAGRQRGAEDDRNLWPEFLRLVADIRPRVVVGENVPGLDRTMLAEVVSDLEALGYKVGVLGLAASSIGAPHRRERRFIAANSDGTRLEGRVGAGLRERADQRPAGAHGAFLGDAESERVRAGLRDPEPTGFWRLEPADAGGRPAQPGLGHEPDGVPGWLAGPGPGGAWPAAPGPQADWEAPRTGLGIEFRAAKLKALGNAIVPQVAELVGRAINELCAE